MIRRLVLVCLLAAMTISADACGIRPGGCCCYRPDEWWSGEKVKGSGRLVEVERGVKGFREVHLGTVGTLYIELGEREGLVIKGEANIIEHIETDVRLGTLTITNERDYNLRPTRSLEYYLTAASLEGIALSSAGDARVLDIVAPHFSITTSSSGGLEAGSIETTHLDVNISSSGDVVIRYLQAENLDVSISSSGGLVIEEGGVNSQEVRLSSAGSYRADRLESRRADLRLSSSGSAYIMVTDDLNAHMSSSGSVYYSGNPRIRQRTSSSGRLKRLDV